MNEIFYKPLTPTLRGELNKSIDASIKELKECNMNGLVSIQILAKMQLKKLINSLPDGYPMPFAK